MPTDDTNEDVPPVLLGEPAAAPATPTNPGPAPELVTKSIEHWVALRTDPKYVERNDKGEVVSAYDASKKLDTFFVHGARAWKGWRPNQPLTEHEFERAIEDFKKVSLGGLGTLPETKQPAADAKKGGAS